MTASQSSSRAPRFGRWSAFLAGAAVGLAAVAADGLVREARRRATVQAADSVAEVSARSWKLIARRTLKEFTDDRIPAVAAASAFYALLALFPALAVFVSLFGLVGDLQGAQRQIAAFQGLLPAGGVSVLSEQITRLAITSHASLGLTFFVSLLLSLWTSNAGMKGVIGGLNVAYECREQRNFFVLNLVSLAFTVGAILFSTAAMAAVVAAPEVLAWLGLRTLAHASLLRWPALFVVAVGGLSLLYRFAPSRPRARWRWITPGGVLAAVGWMGMSVAFSAYVGRFGSYDRTYGPLGAIVGFMTWIWLSLTIVLTGAEFNSELEDQVGAES
ncbi:MAG: YihY/virulence factor BrkB family protein [Phenylobacterium sp.]